MSVPFPWRYTTVHRARHLLDLRRVFGSTVPRSARSTNHARDVDADGGRAHASRDVHGHVHDDGLVHDVADLELAHEGLACGGDDEGV